MKHTLQIFLLLLLSLLLSACGISGAGETVPGTAPVTVPAETVSSARDAEGRQAFLDALLSQIGSSGEILPEGERYAVWFARRQGFDAERWGSDDVAWCVCYLYWGMDQCGRVEVDFGDELLRSADVDLFFSSFTGENRKTDAPLPGDIVFFDTDPTDDDPTVNHAGAVLEVTEDTIYIIEGNTLRGRTHPTGTAAVRQYPLTDPTILGYGVLNWK